MCNFSEGIIEDSWNEGWNKGMTQGIVRSILDLPEELGDIPADIHSRISAEGDTETLRVWHKAAARAENLSTFREILS